VTLLVVAFIAGALSVLAPCIVGILPVLVGYSAQQEATKKGVRVITGLALSIVFFSLILKASTVLISVPQSIWQYISGLIIMGFGIATLFPRIWEAVAGKLKLQQLGAKGQAKALRETSGWADFLLGASLGPVFSSCSPTYALIVATVLPVSFARGFIYLLAFVAGLSLAILGIVTLGQKAVRTLGWAINPNGWFKRALGMLFILMGLAILTGADKSVLSHLVQSGWFNWQLNLETTMRP